MRVSRCAHDNASFRDSGGIMLSSQDHALPGRGCHGRVSLRHEVYRRHPLLGDQQRHAHAEGTWRKGSSWAPSLEGIFFDRGIPQRRVSFGATPATITADADAHEGVVSADQAGRTSATILRIRLELGREQLRKVSELRADARVGCRNVLYCII